MATIGAKDWLGGAGRYVCPSGRSKGFLGRERRASRQPWRALLGRAAYVGPKTADGLPNLRLQPMRRPSRGKIAPHNEQCLVLLRRTNVSAARVHSTMPADFIIKCRVRRFGADIEKTVAG
jgi:hypothetical protein